MLTVKQTVLDCRHWVKKGVCLYEQNCKFSHDPEKKASGAQKKRKKRKNGHLAQGVRNDCQNAIFRRFLIDTFGFETLQGGVLVVAGGNGSLALELVNLNGVRVVAIDPRPMGKFEQFQKRCLRGILHRTECFQKYNNVSLEELQQQGVQKPTHIRLFFDEWCWNKNLTIDFEEKIRQAQSVFWSPTGLKQSEASVEELELPISDQVELIELLDSVSIVVGLHPDQATDAICEFAREKQKPFAIVPCCVYPNEFPNRKLDGKLVKSYEDFVVYLQAKYDLQESFLDFEGRNRVLFSH